MLHHSAHVAPLNIVPHNKSQSSQQQPQSRPQTSADGSWNSLHTQDQDHNLFYLQSQMTPPATPNGSQEDLMPDGDDALAQESPVFHNFLRALYAFDPAQAAAESSVTLRIDVGDVVMVHSVHTNGWADGTRLATGARGWLPTNYCEPYEPEEMGNLLKALLDFWDLMRSNSVNDEEIFSSQDFIQGLIAGVRCFLQRRDCLSRESALVQRCEPLRKCRKSLLAEIGSLVKTAKRLQESHRGTLLPAQNTNDIIDDMHLKSFRLITKAVRFLDVLEIEEGESMAEEQSIPPTPPADQTSFERNGNDGPAPSWSKRLSSLATPPEAGALSSLPNRLSQNSLHQTRRLSSAMAHRVSLAGPSPLSRPHHLASERLNKSHDKFLSNLGSFIGRLQFHSHSRLELATAIKLSAASGGELLAVMDSVCSYCSSNMASLNLARTAMFGRIHSLVFSARDILAHAAAEGTDVIVPRDNGILLAAGTACVRAAGESVTKTKAAIERSGDFEFELENDALGIDLTILDMAVQERVITPCPPEQQVIPPAPLKLVTALRRTSPGAASVDKPLPLVPKISIPVDEQQRLRQPLRLDTQQSSRQQVSRPVSRQDNEAPVVASTMLGLNPLPPLLPELSALDHGTIAESLADGLCFDAVAASSAGSCSTYLSRDSETSLLSDGSTRATTPDQAHGPRTQVSISDLSAASSMSQVDEAADEVETRLLERTYAHELLFNKESQVTGGSLPALVERLTTHESTPDATFVSAFYLTFRLFCTPVKLTEALVDRFDYVGESPHMAGPVRLRVYNAFKGWLESHWRDETDRAALPLIMSFAEEKLGVVLPSAGRRLVELARRVSGDGPLVPRLVSSMGKTNTAIAQYVPADSPLPQPAISRSQLHLLSGFRAGTAAPTVVDFEPLELARQLTLKQMAIFCAILPEELLASQWMKKGGVDAPHVKAMSTLSTDLSNLVADTILEHAEVKKRALVIKHWIKVAHQCHELHNYDGLMAIICSLNSSTISRLRKTWDAVSPRRKETLRLLQQVVEPSQNHKVLRTRLHDHVPPCLPFLGMYLTDLTFVDIGNPATKQISLGHGPEDLTVVNFDKHSRTAKIIGDLQRFQIPYRLVEVADMQEWLAAQIRRVRDGDDENVQVSYYRKSLMLEPREAAPRRDHEPPTPVSSGVGSGRTDLFAWMTRGDRGGQTPTPAPS
ncbi:hypothetical protein CDD81_3859 [Ophiocordyceps australis]|uniref:Uncharacterized protein n=1 Tax=Ophiocordyceps australis TaxID=1399860 RepID=A0A2C5YB09_9HYPO|nr:hypothetical protein CDD81_3859 [Ophiocordyceps australis]